MTATMLVAILCSSVPAETLAGAPPAPAAMHHVVLELGFGASRDAMGNGRAQAELVVLGRGERVAAGGVLAGDPFGLATREVRGFDGEFPAALPGERFAVPELYYGATGGVRRKWGKRAVHLFGEAGAHRIWLEETSTSILGGIAMNGSVTLGYVGARASVRWPFGRDDRGTRALSVIVRQDLGRERLIGITGSAFGDIRSDFGVVGGLSVSLLVSIASDLPLPR